VRKIKPYSAGITKEEVARRHGLDATDVIKLASNENPFGPSPEAQAAIKNYARRVALYPEDYPQELIQAISDYVGLPETMIVPGGNGADEVMDLVLKLVISPGDEVIIHTPTFPYYNLLTNLYGGSVVKVPMKEDYSFPVDNIIERVNGKTKLVIICSPNNPTGTVISESDLRRILGAGVLVMLDEAYVEFAEGSLIRLCAKYENLVVLRTFSKAFGLAGLRVGYGVANEEFIQQAMKIKPPHNVNLLAQKAATAALGDLDYLKRTVEKIKTLRAELFKELKGIKGIKTSPSQGNFLLITLMDRDASDVVFELEKRGIIVRGCKGFGLDDSIRVTVGTKGETQAFLKNLKDVLG
jgi:histidinol-phosphate aminotransferase